MAPKKRGWGGGSKPTTTKEPPARALESEDDDDDYTEDETVERLRRAKIEDLVVGTPDPHRRPDGDKGR